MIRDTLHIGMGVSFSYINSLTGLTRNTHTNWKYRINIIDNLFQIILLKGCFFMSTITLKKQTARYD